MKFFQYILVVICSLLCTMISTSQVVPHTSVIEIEQTKNIKKAEIIVGGMSCQKGCSDGIDKTLRKVKGISKAKTKLETGICQVTYDESIINMSDIIQVIVDRGYTAKIKS